MFSSATGAGAANSARYVFLDPGARDFYADGERAVSDSIGAASPDSALIAAFAAARLECEAGEVRLALSR